MNSKKYKLCVYIKIAAVEKAVQYMQITHKDACEIIINKNFRRPPVGFHLHYVF